VPPDPAGFDIQYSEDGLTVLVPVELWIQIAEYMVDVDGAKKKYETMRNIYLME
jgi:hypothetical protein